MTMPPPEKYRELLAALHRAKAALPKKPTETDEEARARQIDAALFALRSVMTYFQADADVLNAMLTQPLGVIEAAVHNAAQGAKPVLLNPPPPLVDGDKSRKGKAPGTVAEDVRAALAFAVKFRMLETATLHTGEATNWVARQAATCGMTCENGTPITSRQVKNWWEAVHRGTPKGASETFRRLKALPEHARLLRPPLTAEKRKECGARALGVIRACAATTPLFAPSPTARLKEKSA